MFNRLRSACDRNRIAMARRMQGHCASGARSAARREGERRPQGAKDGSPQGRDPLGARFTTARAEGFAHTHRKRMRQMNSSGEGPLDQRSTPRAAFRECRQLAWACTDPGFDPADGLGATPGDAMEFASLPAQYMVPFAVSAWLRIGHAPAVEVQVRARVDVSPAVGLGEHGHRVAERILARCDGSSGDRSGRPGPPHSINCFLAILTLLFGNRQEPPGGEDGGD